MKKLYTSLAIILLLGVPALLNYNITKTETVEAASVTITRTSDPAENSFRYIKYSDYPDGTWWPAKDTATPNDGCVGNGSNYAGDSKKKTMPFLGASSEVESSYKIAGDSIAYKGDCSSRYTDGGQNRVNEIGSNGPWILPTALGGWALPGVTTPTGFSASPSLVKNTSGTCVATDTGLCPGTVTNYPVVWGQNHRYGYSASELPTKDHFQMLWNRLNNETSYPYVQPKTSEGKTIILTSSGTTLLRNTFTLTQDQINGISSDTSIRIRLQSDDFTAVYLNGILLRNYNDGLSIYGDFYVPQSFKNNLIAGSNVLSFQVSDKARWMAYQSGSAVTPSGAAGIWYSMAINTVTNTTQTTGCDCDLDNPAGTNCGQYDIHDQTMCTPVPSTTPNFSCQVTPETGLAPLVVSVTASEIVNIASPLFDYDMNGDGTYEYIGRTTPVYYTYESKGSYVVKVRETSSTPDIIRECTPNPVGVEDPTDTGGGEVTP